MTQNELRQPFDSEGHYLKNKFKKRKTFPETIFFLEQQDDEMWDLEARCI